MELSFTKGHGTGNDFVLFTDPAGEIELTEERVRWLADRHKGIGADGVIRAVKARHVAGYEDAGDVWFMDYRNADGSVSEMCGNGVRVFALYLLTEGLVEPDGGQLDVGTRAGIKRVTLGETAGERTFSVAMGIPEIGDGETLVAANGLDVARPSLSVDVGNPHLVVALAHDEELDQLQLAIQPETDPHLEAGANIEFCVPGEITEERGEVRMRVHERGVGETQSCGTGAVAAATAMRHWANDGGRNDSAPSTWLVHVPGGTLTITVDDSGATLAGPAQLVFSASVQLP